LCNTISVFMTSTDLTLSSTNSGHLSLVFLMLMSMFLRMCLAVARSTYGMLNGLLMLFPVVSGRITHVL
jgi:hypothetical protein